MVMILISFITINQLFGFTDAETSIFEDSSSLSSRALDNCDRFKWRKCQVDSDCEWENWKQKSYSEAGNIPPLWESKQSYPNFNSYKCSVPSIPGCTASRCLPDISNDGGHFCTESSDCYDGQICDNSKCINCAATDSFARAACHQVATSGYSNTGAYEVGQSGCAGDHCLHVCAYDTMCFRILHDTTEVDLQATHNQLPGVFKIDNEEMRKEMTRPSVCGGNDAGEEQSGMRCAGDLHRVITSKQKTPDNIKSRDMNVVELSIKHPNWEDWVTFDSEEMSGNGVIQEDSIQGARGVVIGYEVPAKVVIDNGRITTVGKGARGYGLANWHFGKIGNVQCDVRFSEEEPLYQDWGGVTVDTLIKRSTLLTRVCVRWEDDEPLWCADWGTTSDFHQTLAFNARCMLTGPQVEGVIPTVEQRAIMKDGLYNAFQSKTLVTSEILRAAFHDASTYHNDPLQVKGGAQGCMRFEHVHGNAANRGLAFFVDNLPEVINCGGWHCPFSVADILQYAGAVAVEYTQGPSFSSDVKWGRVDAGYIFCLGELQLHMPDANGGHEEGAFHVGSSDIQGRLEVVFDSTETYFETQLGLTKGEWVAFLGGGHSLGGVRGLITARNTRFNFDNSVETFDNLYFKRLVMAKDSNLLSLCPQMKKLGHAHFWEPGETWKENGHIWQVLIDTDVSTTINSETMASVRQYALDQDAFFNTFVKAYHKVSELGYQNLRFVELNNSRTPSPSASPPTECEDSPFQMKFGKKKRTCGWVLKKINKRCKKKGVSQHCSLACDPITSSCEEYHDSDSTRKFFLKSGRSMTCKRVSNNVDTFCTTNGVSQTCRKSC